MYESTEFFDEKTADGTNIRRTFFFKKPTVVYKLKIHEIHGAAMIAMKIEFLGMDRTAKQNIWNPFQGESVFKSNIPPIITKQIFSNNTI